MAIQLKNPLPSRSRLRKLVSTLREVGSRHKERHTPSPFGFVIADCIHYLDANRWEEIVADQSIFMRRSVLKHFETSGPENVKPRYVLMFRGNQPVAALAAQIVSVSGDLIKNSNADPKREGIKALKNMIAPARVHAAKQLRENILVAGNLLSWGFHGIAFAKGEPQSELWHGIGEALYRLRRANRLHGQTDLVLVKDITPAQNGLNQLERLSYRPLETEPNMVLKLDLSWRTYQDYLAALDAKYRRNAKDQSKKLAAAGCVIEPLADLTPHSSRLHALYKEVVANADVRLVSLPKNFLPGLAIALGNDFACNVVRRGDEILGFVTALRDGETAIAYYIGFDRAEAEGGLPLYLQLLHSTIGTAIQWGCRKLSLGRTALEPKAALGAKPEPMSVYLRHRVPVMNWLVRAVINSVPHVEAPQRSPFKNVEHATTAKD